MEYPLQSVNLQRFFYLRKEEIRKRAKPGIGKGIPEKLPELKVCGTILTIYTFCKIERR